MARSKSQILWLPAIVLVVSNIIPQTTRAQETATNSAATASQKDKETQQRQELERQELEKKAPALLNEIASSAWSLKLPENRVFVMANTADLLWFFDEKRARTLYWEVLNSLNSMSPAVRSTGETPSKAEQEKIVQAYFSIYTLRQKVLRQIARRDSQLALDMLRATRQVPPRQTGFEIPLPDDRQLEQEIATEVAARDPAQALQVARQSLAKGLTFELLNLLYQLNEYDREKASQFAGDIITKLRSVNMATDLRASVIALQLLETSRTPDGNRPTAVLSSGNVKVNVLGLNDEQRRDLVELLTNAALNVSANSNLLYQISEAMPEIEQFFPERRVPLERKLAAFNETLTKQQHDYITRNTLIRTGNAEELVRSAIAGGDEDRSWLYNQAAIIAVAQGKSDSFRDFLNKEVSQSAERNKILDSLDAEEAATAAGRKQLDELRKLLPKIRRKEERATALAELALLLKEKGEDEEASSLLDEAATLIKTDLKDDRQTNALLALLCAYAIVDPAKAFALAQRTVDQANRQISLMMLLDRVVKSGAVKKSEIILEQAGILPLDFLMFRYGKGVAALAKADFNRTKALADRFDRNELRLMAQLLVVKGACELSLHQQVGWK